MKTNLKKYLLLGAILLSTSSCLYAGWSIKEWVDKRDAALIKSGYDKAMNEVKAQAK